MRALALGLALLGMMGMLGGLACSSQEPHDGASAGSAARGPSAEASASTEDPAQGPVVARVDGRPVALAEARAELARRGSGGDVAARRAAVEAVIARRLAAAEARRRGVGSPSGLREGGSTPPSEAGVEARARAERRLRDALFRQVRDTLELSEEALRAHHAATQGRYVERRVRLRRESFPSREAARAAEARLGPAGRLDPATAETIGPAPAASLPPSVLPEALRLRRPGDRTLVEREGDVALVELVEVIPAAPQPFEAVRDRVERSLRTLRGQEAFHQLLEGLRDGAEVEIDAALLSQDAMWVAGEDEPQSGS